MKITSIVLLVFHLNVFAQHQQQTLFVYNVAFGGITSGIGAIINRPKEVNWKRAFLKGFWQGDVGGLLNYTSKKTLYLINKNQEDIYSWPAKLLHAAGNSIIENAASYQPFLQNWNIDFGLLRFDFSFVSEKKLKVRLLPEAIVATIIASNYGRFDVASSLRTGEIIFRSHKILDLPNAPLADGVTFGRTIIYVNNPQSYSKDRTLSHELVHRYQFNEYQVFNTWLQPIGMKIKSKKLQTIFSKYVYFDMPYFYLPYYIEKVRGGTHFYANFYEFEADRFATNAYVKR